MGDSMNILVTLPTAWSHASSLAQEFVDPLYLSAQSKTDLALTPVL
jgi:hypothetical protein